MPCVSDGDNPYGGKGIIRVSERSYLHELKEASERGKDAVDAFSFPFIVQGKYDGTKKNAIYRLLIVLKVFSLVLVKQIILHIFAFNE